MQPLKITAHLASAIAVYDDWSPSLDSLLEWLLLDRQGITTPNPTPEQVERSRSIVDANLPLEKGSLGGEWYWKVSSPCYTILSEMSDRFRKRWDYQDHNLDWGKRKPKWSTSEGAEKNYDLPLYLRSTHAITWYVVGELLETQELLNGCSSIGKKRSIGNGQVSKWSVHSIKSDWHLWGPLDQLMRPIPYRLLGEFDLDVTEPYRASLLHWGWRPPAWLHSNKELCLMPTTNVQRCQSTMAQG